LALKVALKSRPPSESNNGSLPRGKFSPIVHDNNLGGEATMRGNNSANERKCVIESVEKKSQRVEKHSVIKGSMKKKEKNT